MIYWSRFAFFIMCASFFTSTQAATDFPWQKPTQQGRPQPGVPLRPQALETFSSTSVKECSTVINALRFNSAYSLLAQAMSGLESNTIVRHQLGRYDMIATNVSWNDAGRDHYSSGGRNMSDVTLASLVMGRDGEIKTIKQPIVRLSNYTDTTVDVNLADVFVPVGNAWGVKPFAVSLKELLENLPEFTSWRETTGSLFAERDSQVLVSAQAAILPVPENGEAHFVPAVYNYQSSAAHSAALVIMVSNRGTSVTLIDNTRDLVTDRRGQMIFHNNNGQKTAFTAQAEKAVEQTAAGRKRIKDLKKSGQSIAGQSGVNQVMMITVPLQVPRLQFRATSFLGGGVLESMGASGDGYLGSPTRSMRATRSAGGAASLDRAVVDVAKYSLGKFDELNNQGGKLVRDQSLPIRVDVVRYMVSSTTELRAEELATLPQELKAIYEAGSNIGSLVTGDLRDRVTRNYQPQRQPWWNSVIIYAPVPPLYRPKPWTYFQELWGPTWIYRFANEEMARRTIQEMKQN